MKALLSILWGLLLISTVGCAGPGSQPSPSPDAVPLDQGTVDAETYRAIEGLLEGNAVQSWAALDEAVQRRAWDSLIEGIPFPEGTVRLQQTNHVDRRARAVATEQEPRVRRIEAAGVAWLPTFPTIAAAVATESQMGPTLPERIHHVVVSGERLSNQQLSRAFGFDVSETVTPPTVDPLPIPPNTQVALVPVLLYHASTFEVWNDPPLGEARQQGTGQAYQYGGIILLTFVIEP